MWDDPEGRVAQYLVPFALNYSFDARQVDALTLSEFDMYAQGIDQIVKQAKASRRKN